MARLRPLTKDEVSPKVAARLEAAAKVFGAPLIPAGIQAYGPPILEAGQALGAAPALSGKLPPVVRSLVCMRAAEMAGCPF